MTLKVSNCFGALRHTCPRWSISKTANVYFTTCDGEHGWCVVVRVLLYIPCGSPAHCDVSALFLVFVRNAPMYPLLRTCRWARRKKKMTQGWVVNGESPR